MQDDKDFILNIIKNQKTFDIKVITKASVDKI